MQSMISKYIRVVALILFSGAFLSSCAQSKKLVEAKDDLITVEDLWASGKFWQRSVYGIRWMNDGKFYTSLERGKIVKYDITSGELIEAILDVPMINPDTSRPFSVSNYQFNQDESKILLTINEEAIFRHSSKADFYIYDLKKKKLTQLSSRGKQMYATFSPDSKNVAFVRDNNLFCYNIQSGEEKQITEDGKWGNIINGSADWVYEEEFSFAKAFFWSPDGKKIAFYRFDESMVREYNMQEWNEELYPQDYKFKYPKAGERNSDIKILCYDLTNDETKVVLDETGNDNYIPRVLWTQNPDILSVRRLNRLQNHLELLHINTSEDNIKVVLNEESDTYIDISDDLTYLKNTEHFIWSSEQSGYKHLYLYNLEGKLINQITKGDWEVDEFYGINEKTNKVYFTSTEVSPLERYPYRVDLDGKNKTQLTKNNGCTSINLSGDFSYFLSYNSAIDRPIEVTLYETEALKPIRTLQDNEQLKSFVKENDLGAEFFNFTTSEGVELNGYMIKPPELKKAKKNKKKYPVLMYVYGGPGHQTVKNTWMSVNYFWFQMLARQGYIVVSVDNRGTGGRGAEFKKSTYAQLGKYETIDQIEAAKYLGTLPFVDKDRIGIWGWSYGGYMSSLCITKGADYFKTAIAVAPVTNWKFYDTIYTERYLKKPQDNEAGYEDNSPVNYAKLLKGNYLIIHGTGDDNVHLQNTVAMQNALIKANKQFDTFLYPDRNHGIYGGVTRLHLYNLMTNYILKKL